MTPVFDLRAPRTELLGKLFSAVDECKKQNRPIAQYRFGFYRLSFSPTRQEEGFTLHLWSRELPADDYPHTHIFSLTSRILSGRLKDTTWSLVPDAQGPLKCIRPHCSETACWDEDLGERVRLEKTREKINGPDDIYDVSLGEFHTTDIVEFPTITLMEKKNVQRGADPMHLVPWESQTPTRSFDYYSDSQEEIWARFEKALEPLRREIHP